MRKYGETTGSFTIRAIVTLGALAIAVVHLIQPTIKIDRSPARTIG